MTKSRISGESGNWATLRKLVLRLLDLHDEALGTLDIEQAKQALDVAGLRKDIDRCLEEIFGDASTDSLKTAIRLVQAEQAGLKEDVDGAHAKANAAHTKANQNAKMIAKLEENSKAIARLKKSKTPDGTGKAGNKMVIGLISIVSVLVNIIWELLKNFVLGG